MSGPESIPTGRPWTPTPVEARWLLGCAMLGLRYMVRRDGAPMPVFAPGVLSRLAELADVPEPAMSGSGPAIATVKALEVAMVPVAEAADLVGRSERHVRRLATAGRVRHRRIGARVLLIDIDSLKSVLRRAAA